MRGNAFFLALLTAAAVLAPGPVSAQTRGLTIELKASEARGAPVAGEVQLYGASYALVIGIDEYTNGWPRLSNAVKDARLVAEELERKSFEVILKKNPTSSELKVALEEFFVIKGEDPLARLFVWYAGHGHSEDDEGFLVPADAPLPEVGARFKLKALPIRRFGEYVRLAESKHVFAVFDACFAGTIFTTQRGRPPAAITHATTLPVRQFLTSGDAGQTVSDDGTFRELFLRALRGEERADANGDGYVTGTEMGLYLSDRVTNLTEARQTPRYGKLRDKDYDLGDFVFALARPTAPATARRPTQPATGADKETVFWQSMKDSTNPAVFEEFLKQFPKGTFAGLARLKLEELRKQQTAAVSAPKPKLAPAVKPAVGVYPERYKPGDAFKDCTVCPEMVVVVPAGSFRMGDLQGGGDEDEKPVHTVTIPSLFAVGKYEVTQAEYQAVMGTNPSHFKGERNPVEQVSWDDAKGFTRKLSARTGKEYRLLSEAEWEYMARAGSSTKYRWGNDIGFSRAKYGSGTGTVPVGSYAANAFGVYDTVGNVWEWVEDCWHGSYSGSPSDGSVWTTGDCKTRVYRGGGWNNSPWYLRSADRSRSGPGNRVNLLGFRVARTLP